MFRDDLLAVCNLLSSKDSITVIPLILKVLIGYLYHGDKFDEEEWYDRSD